MSTNQSGIQRILKVPDTTKTTNHKALKNHLKIEASL